MKLVIDMNLSPEWQPALKARGIDAAHWSSLGAVAAPDHDIAAWAHAHEAVVLTRDLDFGMLMATSGQPMPGIIQLRLDQVRIDEHIDRVLLTLSRFEVELGSGALVTLSADKTRIRSSNT
jgi:predicted nuclease of predicted toxin-antitoxin system